MYLFVTVTIERTLSLIDMKMLESMTLTMARWIRMQGLRLNEISHVMKDLLKPVDKERLLHSTLPMNFLTMMKDWHLGVPCAWWMQMERRWSMTSPRLTSMRSTRETLALGFKRKRLLCMQSRHSKTSWDPSEMRMACIDMRKSSRRCARITNALLS